MERRPSTIRDPQAAPGHEAACIAHAEVVRCNTAAQIVTNIWRKAPVVRGN